MKFMIQYEKSPKELQECADIFDLLTKKFDPSIVFKPNYNINKRIYQVRFDLYRACELFNTYGISDQIIELLKQCKSDIEHISLYLCDSSRELVKLCAQVQIKLTNILNEIGENPKNRVVNF